MSNPELSADNPSSGDVQIPTSGEDDHGELKVLIDAIAAQLTDADRRHTATLDEMQDRVATMEREAEALRHHVPPQFAPAFERIESGVAELAKRLSHPIGREEVKPANSPVTEGVRSFKEENSSIRMDAGTAAPDRGDPWDTESAEALTQIYEADAAEFTSRSAIASAHGSIGGRVEQINQEWLANRFADIAKGIEQSLAEIRPDHGFNMIGRRLDQFEQQFTKLIEGVATRSDLDAIRLIESHVREVVNHLVQTHDQLARLNAIEAQLATITRTLADVQDGASPSENVASAVDVDAIARAAAEHAAMRFADIAPAGNDPVSELRPLIERMMSENRLGGETTAALLDTLQQAMIRLLDRVDAIELAQHENRASGAPSYGYGREARHSDFVAPPHLDDEPVAYKNPDSVQGEASDEVARSGPAPVYDADEPINSALSKNEKLRQDFIAEARRAKIRLTSTADDEIVISSPAEGGAFAMSSPDARRPHGSRPIRPAAGRSKASGPSGPSPRLVALAIAALLALSGLWYTLGMDFRRPALERSSMPVPASSDVRSSNASDIAKGAAQKSQTSPPAGAEQPNKGAEQAPDLGPRGDATPKKQQQGQVVPSVVQGTRTTLPMVGVAVDINDPVTEPSLHQATHHEAMRATSGKLGDGTARESGPVLVHAAMTPAVTETDGLSASGGPKGTLEGTSRSMPLDLPAATVGPLSLRLAAANGDPSAEFEVGARLAEGKGTPQNFKEAAKWYARSADHGFAPAQYRLGTFYERGLGLTSDRALAAAWYRRAADQGNVKAMHNLAVLSANRADQSPDYTTAAQWFEQAAKRGLADSQFNLAILYENGLGVKRDLKQAYMWISLAARNKDGDAVRRRDILRGKLTSDEIVAAEQMIAAWKPIPVDRNVNDARAAGEEWKKNPKNGITG
jgi:localization factor PodJL